MKVYILYFSYFLAPLIHLVTHAQDIEKPVSSKELKNLRAYQDMFYATDRRLKPVSIEKEPNSVHSIIVYSPFSNDDMNILKHFPNLVDLEIRATEITDQGLRIIPELKRLESLDLSDLPITDEGVKNLSLSRSLKSLVLTHTAITNKVFKYLRQMPAVEYVFFGLIEDRGEIDDKEIKKFHSYLKKKARNQKTK